MAYVQPVTFRNTTFVPSFRKFNSHKCQLYSRKQKQNQQKSVRFKTNINCIDPNTSTTSTVIQDVNQPSYDWLNQWYPVAVVTDLKPKQPYAFTVWDSPYVLYQDRATKEYIVFDDICPHRSAPLSHGRIYERPDENDPTKTHTTLECGYHGWRFDCKGQCIQIPNNSNDISIPQAANLNRRYPTCVKVGLVFVWLGEQKPDFTKIPLPDIVTNTDPKDLFISVCSFRSFPLSFITVLENILDPAHLPWSHHAVMGNRNTVEPGGRVRITNQNISNGILDCLVEGTSSKNVTKVTYKAPCCATTHAETPTGFNVGVAFLPIPTSRYTCNVLYIGFFTNCPPILKQILKIRPQWHFHMGTNLVLDGDSLLLHGQEAHLQKTKWDGIGGAWKQCFVGNAWDTHLIQFRKWMDQNASTMPFKIPLASPQSFQSIPKEVMNDRFTHHTKDCAYCSVAFRNLKWLRIGSYVIAGIALAIVLFAGLIRIALSRAEFQYHARPLWLAACVGLIVCLIMIAAQFYLSALIRGFTYTNTAQLRAQKS